MEEGCLSLPGNHETVKRPDRIHETYLDEELKEHDEWVEGYLAKMCIRDSDTALFMADKGCQSILG